MLAYAPNPSQLHNNDLSENHLDASPQSDDEESSHKKVGKWTPEEDELLRKYAPMYDEKQWRKISNHIPGRSSIQCLHRWTKILKPGLVKGPWTAEEDQRLLTWVRTEGPTKWAQAANFIKGRSGKQCRERWFNNLNPNVKKGNWSKMEDELIFELYQKYGTSWSKIAKYLPGRTENAIKNRFYSTLRKLAADKRKVKNDAQGDSESVKSDESPEEPKTCPAISTSQAATAAAAALGMSSRLYKLLQDTTYVEEPNEHKESSTRDGKEVQEGIETSNNESAQKATQDSNEKAKKVAVKKEPKTVEQTSHAGQVKSRVDTEDNDLAFEKFLLSMDETTDEDFLSREFESNCDSEDLLHFDDLQQKILNYCQENIHGLAEAFKDIANNDIDVATHPERRPDISKIRSMPQMMPIRNNAANNVVKPKIETTTSIASPGNLFQQNIKGIKISAPIPITHISSNKKPNPVEMAPSTGSNARNPMAYYAKDEDGHGQGYLMMPPATGMDSYEMFVSNGEEMYGGKNLIKREGVPNGHINNLNKLVHKAQEVGSKNNPEGEKRLTFLFQQLHSLEDLLTNTRNELMKLESSYNHNTQKDIKEIANQEAFIERALKTADEGYEPHGKKRKRF